jgi:hypothetical protein
MKATHEYMVMQGWAKALLAEYGDMIMTKCYDVAGTVFLDVYSTESRGLVASWNCEAETGWVVVEWTPVVPDAALAECRERANKVDPDFYPNGIAK